jgi:hypothetical protein
LLKRKLEKAQKFLRNSPEMKTIQPETTQNLLTFPTNCQLDPGTLLVCHFPPETNFKKLQKNCKTKAKISTKQQKLRDFSQRQFCNVLFCAISSSTCNSVSI